MTNNNNKKPQLPHPGTTMVPFTETTTGIQRGNQDTSGKRHTDTSEECTKTVPTAREDGACGSTTLGINFEAMGMSKGTAETLTAYWADTTQRQYTLVLKRWCTHCRAKGINLMNPTLLEGIDYLQCLFTGGAAHTTVNTVQALRS